MTAEHAALRLLRFLSADVARSGEDIADALGCSRSAVWKQVETLRALGVGVESMAGKGYWLTEPLELLEPDAIERALPEREAAYLNAIEVWPQLDSTNSELLRRPLRQQHAVAVLAERQTSGRGRHGRPWFSPLARNIYLSLGWRFEAGISELSALPLLLAMAASEALQTVGLAGLRIKWPNDLLVDDRKLGGCLVEIQGDANGPCNAVLGVGINVHMPPRTEGADAIEQPWTAVANHVEAVSRRGLAATLLTALIAHLVRFERLGFDTFMNDWDRQDALAGRPLEVMSPAGRVRGIARGVSRRGGLLVETPEGVTELHAGEVTLRP
jgi:BirA family biotin operon repressor/biotin-[acetyl-CoA-carboxylase] ligase